MSGVRLEKVAKTYPGNIVGLAGIDLKIASGDLFVLLGPSGSGKSTLLRLLAGLEQPDSGRVVVDEKEVNELPPYRRGVSYLGQRPVLYPHRTVRENLLFGLKVNDELQTEAESLAAAFGLERFLRRSPRELSGGELQRVALARALLRRGRLILLDEPLASLDGPLRWDLRGMLHLLQRQQRATMIYVTHDQEEARSLADRLAVLNQGRIVQVGTPAECLLRPETTFVARHLGWPPMSLQVGRLERKEAVLVLNMAGNQLIAPRHWEPLLGRELLVGSRSHSGPDARFDSGPEGLSQAFLFDASTGRLLHAPGAQG